MAEPRSTREFYIGYLRVAPVGIARIAGGSALLFVLLAGVASFAFGWSQRTQRAGHYEFGQASHIEGTLSLQPVPAVFVAQSSNDHAKAGRIVVLTGETKHGVGEDVKAFDGESVYLEGAMLYDGQTTMMEVWSAQLGVDAAAPGNAGASETVTLVGELVDTKCFVGAMRPGYGKTHRGCAIVCLEGGVPPGLWIPDGNSGEGRLVYLEATESAPIDPQWAGYTVTVTGELRAQDGMESLRLSAIAVR